MTDTKPRSELTRWNRAGLRRFRYLDANAATLLEELRLRLAERFPDWQTMQVDDGELDSQRRSRIATQIRAPRGVVPDWGWEIARAFARAGHVLVEHVDAYANEGYLRTATEWESLRRLLALIDYQPAPAASASVPIALAAKAAGTVKKGLSIKHSPEDGRAPIAFETLEDIEVDPALDALRPKGRNRSREPLEGDTLSLEGVQKNLVLGEPIVIASEDGATLSAHVITKITPDATTTSIVINPKIPPGTFIRGQTWVFLNPKDRLDVSDPIEAKVGGWMDLRLCQPIEGLRKGDVIVVSDASRREYRQVAEYAGSVNISFDEGLGTFDAAYTTLSRPLSVDAENLGATSDETTFDVAVVGDWRRLADDFVACEHFAGGRVLQEYSVSAAVYHPVDPTKKDTRSGQTVLTLMSEEGDGAVAAKQLGASFTLHVPPAGPGTWPIDPLLATTGISTKPLSTSKGKVTTSGDLAVMVARATPMLWARLASAALEPEPPPFQLREQFRLRPEASWMERPEGLGELWRSEARVFSHFAASVRLAGWNVNTTSLSAQRLVELESAPAALRPRRRVIVSNGDGMSARVTMVAHVQGSTVELADPLPEGFHRDNLVIHANVVLAGHGERKPEKILGSGDATQVGQSFVLAEPALSFIADPAYSTGVRADVEIKVDGRIWAQVESLRGRGPTEHVYAARTTEEGYLRIEFGDGHSGRRLPTGRNNVRIRYRIGVGAAGNLKAGSAVELASPHPFVESASVPVAASGGSDRRDVESLRRTAPKALLTLGRAASLADFAALAQGHAAVQEASARVGAGVVARAQRVEVIVVAAGGEAPGEPLKRDLEAHLEAHALPGIVVRVIGYTLVKAPLTITLEIDTGAFAPEDVTDRVRTALAGSFSALRRHLGQPLSLSEIYEVVEGVKGVESSTCTFEKAPRRAVWAARTDEIVVAGAIEIQAKERTS